MEGFEPSTSRSTIWRSNQLSYTHRRGAQFNLTGRGGQTLCYVAADAVFERPGGLLGPPPRFRGLVPARESGAGRAATGRPGARRIVGRGRPRSARGVGTAARDLARSRRARLRASRPARRRGEDAELEAAGGRGLHGPPLERLPADLADSLDDRRDRCDARRPPRPRFPGGRSEDGPQARRSRASRGARPPPGTSRRPTAGKSASWAGGRRTRPSRSTDSSFPTARVRSCLPTSRARASRSRPRSRPGVAQVVARDGRIGADDLAPYLDVPAVEIAAALASGAGMENPIVALARVVSATRVTQRIARDLYDRHRPGAHGGLLRGHRRGRPRFRLVHAAEARLRGRGGRGRREVRPCRRGLLRRDRPDPRPVDRARRRGRRGPPRPLGPRLQVGERPSLRPRLRQLGDGGVLAPARRGPRRRGAPASAGGSRAARPGSSTSRRRCSRCSTFRATGA